MQTHPGRVGFASLCLLALAGSSVARAAETTPAKPSATRALRLPEAPYHYADVDLPAHFRTFVARRFDNTPAENPITDHGATLGRVLFYDTRVSANNTIACASCHHQKNSFVDPNRASKGFEGKLTDRHAPSLVALRYYARGRFFWDERGGTLEQQVLLPIQSKVEMGQTLTGLTEVLAKDKDYPELFRKAFGDPKVTPERVGKALAQFLRSMVSYQSKYDEGAAKATTLRESFANFTAQENEGKTLFARNCASCHLTGGQLAHFSINRPQNNGLDADVKGVDAGVGDISLRTDQMGLFKSPSLRNVEFTAPYMHDGRLATLEDVIEHYSKNLKPHPNVSGRLRRPLNFTDSQKKALVAFLKTLSDKKFLDDPRFSDPFVVAQAPGANGAQQPARNNRNRPRARVTVDNLVERIMAFDKDKDGKIAKDELPERMQGLIAKGDTNKDGVLDKDEIKALAGQLAAPAAAAGGGNNNLERALDNVKLPAPKQEKVAAILKANQESARKQRESTRAQLLQKTKEVLSEEEFKKFKEIIERPPPAAGRGGRPAPAPTVDQVVDRLMAFDKNKDGKIAKDELPERIQDLIAKGDTNKDGVLDKDEIKALAVKLQKDGLPQGLTAAAGGPARRGGGNNLERALDNMKLAPPKQEQVAALLKASQDDTRTQRGVARADLLQQTKEILSDEEFKKFKEVVERPTRPGNR